MGQIIYAWNYREWGGAQIYFMSLMKEARKRYDVVALLPRNSDQKLLDYLAAIQVPIEFLPPVADLRSRTGIERLSRKSAILRSELALVKQILAMPGISNSIVHIDLGFWQSFAALAMLARRTHVFTTVHTGLHFFTGLRGIRWRSRGQMISRVPRFHLLASNLDAKESLRPYITPAKYEQVEVAYSGYDPDEVGRVEAAFPGEQQVRERYGISPDSTLLMNVGQFIERKGCWVLLDALKELAQVRSDLEFIWITTSMPSAETLDRVEGYCLDDTFRILSAEEVGPGRHDLLTLLNAADIFVLPSLQEGLPIALVEAMALGRPCIASRINAIPEAIEDLTNGLLIPPNNSKELAVGISRLASGVELRQKLGAAAKETASSKFNEHHVAARMIKLYEAAWKTPR